MKLSCSDTSSFKNKIGDIFPDNIWKCIFLIENFDILIQIAPKFVNLVSSRQ